MLIALLLLALAAPYQQGLSGTVRTSDDRPVAGAIVSIQQNGQTLTATTDEKGAFSISGIVLPAEIDVHAGGFLSIRQTITTSPVAVTLTPSRFRESIVVSPPPSDERWRQPMSGTTTIASATLAEQPGVTTDEQLRMVSGFSLFRRSSSRASNPTTHGVTMRGLSASGASRGLVLFDGLPLNEGFGGWVTWTRIPSLAVSQIAVDRGAEGATFGSDALGGVIDIGTRAAGQPSAIVGFGAGTDGVTMLDASVGRTHRSIDWFATASWFQTDGVIPVAPESQGSVDVPADAQWFNGLVRVNVLKKTNHRLGFSFWGGDDDRGNGTVVQRNRMSGGTGSASYDGVLGSFNLAGRLALSPNDFNQTFSFVAPGRNTETLTSTQFIDTLTMRSLFEVGRPIPRGFAAVRVMLNRTESTFTDERPLSITTLGLRDDSEAISGHVAWTPRSDLTFGAAVRTEWRAAPDYDKARDQATVGHATVSWQISRLVAARGAVATSHRWPTLNELVRPFQAGAVFTQANPDLLPERARSADAALTFGDARWSASIGGFWSVVENAIANVTIQTSPTIIRQRRNTGEATAVGGEIDLEARLMPRLRLRASATIVDARFRSSLEPALEGKRLPQVPRASVSVSGDVQVRPWLQAAAIVRYLSSQYDDDRNVFLLAPATQVDFRIFGLFRSFEWYFTTENAADARIEVGRTPLVTLAPGRAFRVGVTWRR